MPKMKPNRKYFFTVEGETEQWYLKWIIGGNPAGSVLNPELVCFAHSPFCGCMIITTISAFYNKLFKRSIDNRKT
jgi:hypothetical protein